MHWSFEIYWFIELCRSAKCWRISLYSEKNFINISTDLIWKVCMGKMSSSQDMGFPKFNSCLKAWILSLAANTVSFSLKFQPYFIHSQDSLPDIQIWMTVVCVILSIKSDIPWKKWLGHLPVQSHVLFLEMAVILQ